MLTSTAIDSTVARRTFAEAPIYAFTTIVTSECTVTAHHLRTISTRVRIRTSTLGVWITVSRWASSVIAEQRRMSSTSSCKQRQLPRVASKPPTVLPAWQSAPPNPARQVQVDVFALHVPPLKHANPLVPHVTGRRQSKIIDEVNSLTSRTIFPFGMCWTLTDRWTTYWRTGIWITGQVLEARAFS